MAILFPWLCCLVLSWYFQSVLEIILQHVNFQSFAYLSLRLIGELIVYTGIQHPSLNIFNFSSEAVRVIISTLLILHLLIMFLFLLNEYLVCYILCVSEINYLQVIAVFEIKQLTSTQ